jgi:hypothetical protein
MAPLAIYLKKKKIKSEGDFHVATQFIIYYNSEVIVKWCPWPLIYIKKEDFYISYDVLVIIDLFEDILVYSIFLWTMK